ncbi:MAG: metallophosphoesterase [Uliginosibacterium sp.]|nr:metallophosphoesterase [Uliginosibacterium sp.]
MPLPEDAHRSSGSPGARPRQLHAAAAAPPGRAGQTADAITGDLYYTLDNGKSDAAMMNAVCFDAFIPGNHEFDMGDSNLKTFLDYLRASTCKTEVMSANIKPQLGVSALAKTTATDYLKPSAVMTRQGQKIGIVGLTVSLKTKTSSRPDATTEFLDEVSAAQAEIDKLKAAGVNKIILMTHQGYDIDKDMAARISGVDVIVGGDSHTLLGDAGLANFGLTPSGAYPTVVSNKDGKQVCGAGLAVLPRTGRTECVLRCQR